MTSSLFLIKLAFKCLHHFAWPLLALGYPLCASVQAIENESYAQTKDLISYWILLSLIYLFEYAFMSLLLWFHLWLYIKLMIIFWLIIPDFGRASYVYNNLIRSMKPQRLNNFWRKCFVEKDDFLLHAERFMKENGTEASEKLIASKANGERLQTEHKDIKDSEAIEKKEITATKQDIPLMSNVVPTQNASSAIAETKGIVGRDTAGGELLTQKEVQKEWTCALCLVTTSSAITLKSHLNGKKHKATIEALKAKKQPAPQKMKNGKVSNKVNSDGKNGDGNTVNIGLKRTVVMNHKVQKPQNLQEFVRLHDSKLICGVCKVVLHSEANIFSHINGKKHLAKMQS